MFFFFLNDPATTEIYPLPLHDALPTPLRAQSPRHIPPGAAGGPAATSICSRPPTARYGACDRAPRSEEHTSELQSQSNLVCRLLLEKKKNSTAKPQLFAVIA